MKPSLIAVFLRNPLSIGAIAPATRFLARAFRRSVLALGPAPSATIYELGPGTGALTRELETLPQRLVLIERESRFAELLKTRFPGLEIRCEDALQSEALGSAEQGSILVSSLPILSLPDPRPFQSLFFELLLSGRFRAILQYTYGPKDPLAPLPPGIRSRRVRVVLLNLPPAVIWQYERG